MHCIKVSRRYINMKSENAKGMCKEIGDIKVENTHTHTNTQTHTHEHTHTHTHTERERERERERENQIRTSRENVIWIREKETLKREIEKLGKEK